MGMYNDFVRKKVEELAAIEKEMNLPKKRMYAMEQKGYMNMAIAQSIAGELMNDIPDRLKLAGVFDRIKKVHEEITLCMHRVYNTAPEDQRQMIDNNVARTTYAVGVKTIGSVGTRERDSGWGVTVSYEDIGTMVDALKDHCLVCTGSPQEQECCKLRKVFDRLGVDVEHVRGECAYRELI